MVDKNLFLHELSVVSILKNEGHYLKEWLDYHLAAGVDHFYLYDNDSPDNQAEVAAPYVDAGLVDYIPLPGKIMQMIAYNGAVKNFKFQTRYMAFIDGDEFIFPKTDSGGGIVAVVDEILSHDKNAAGLAMNWQMFGSNGQETADYSRGVLERFTRRAPKDYASDKNGTIAVKTIANPRTIKFIYIPHFAVYFENFYAVNENGAVVPEAINSSLTSDKIVINHYYTKSREEFSAKVKRGRADLSVNTHDEKNFASLDHNDEFDDGILHYRAERLKTYQPPDKSHADERLINALMENLSPMFLPTTPPEFFAGKTETFLTCRAVADYLKSRLANDTLPKFFEESSIYAVIKSFNGMSFADAQLLIRELPKILPLKYPVVKELRGLVLQIIPQMMEAMHMNGRWGDYFDWEYVNDLLNSFEE